MIVVMPEPSKITFVSSFLFLLVSASEYVSIVLKTGFGSVEFTQISAGIGFACLLVTYALVRMKE